MPSEEGKQVLKLLADGKIDAEQAYRLLKAIGDVEDRERPEPPFGFRAFDRLQFRHRLDRDERGEFLESFGNVEAEFSRAGDQSRLR